MEVMIVLDEMSAMTMVTAESRVPWELEASW